MKGVVTTGEFGGVKMLRFSPLQKNGKLPKREYSLFPKDARAIKDEVAKIKAGLDADQAKVIAAVDELNSLSERMELYALAVVTRKQIIQKVKEQRRVSIEMLPFPMAERNRQIADCIIAHQESAIKQYREKMKTK